MVPFDISYFIMIFPFSNFYQDHYERVHQGWRLKFLIQSIKCVSHFICLLAHGCGQDLPAKRCPFPLLLPLLLLCNLKLLGCHQSFHWGSVTLIDRQAFISHVLLQTLTQESEKNDVDARNYKVLMKFRMNNAFYLLLISTLSLMSLRW